MQYPVTPPANLTDDAFAALYLTTANKDLAARCGPSLRAVERRATRLGLKKPTTPPTLSDAEFRLLYSTTPNSELARRTQRSVHWVAKRAGVLGLTKDPAYRSATARASARANSPFQPGYAVSDEQRARRSATLKGRTLSDDHRKKLSAALKRHYDFVGRRNNRWRANFYGKPYRTWRAAVLARDNYTCQDCGKQRPKPGIWLHVHHLLSWAEFEDLRYEVSNGLTLCIRCHMTRHSRILGRHDYDDSPIPCACGCGTLIAPLDPHGKERRYAHGHSARSGRVHAIPESEFRQLYPNTPNPVLVARYGVSLNTLCRLASQLGLRKEKGPGSRARP